jgi:hypothetical protein
MVAPPYAMWLVISMVVLCGVAGSVVAGWVKPPANLGAGGIIFLLMVIVVVATVAQVADRKYGGAPAQQSEGTSQPTSPSTGSAKQTPTAPKTSQSRGGASAAQGGSATFKHFKVTLRRVRREADVQVLAEVCVRSLPPDPQGNRTRISWDPWSVRAGSKNVDAARSATHLEGGFPAEGTYKVGECASGWIPFPTRAWPTRIIYKNGVGDVAVWDANHPEHDPRTS